MDAVVLDEAIGVLSRKGLSDIEVTPFVVDHSALDAYMFNA